MPDDLQIQCFTLGDWMTNCYLVVAPSGHCWIVDAGFRPAPMLEAISDQNLTPQCIILTHAHVDHIAGLSQVHQAYPKVPMLIHAAERAFLTDPMLNLSAALADEIIAPEATNTLQAGQTLSLDDFTFEIRHTPGHSPGGITLYDGKQGVALVGDALFAGGIGRTDFPTSDHNTLINAIESQLMSLPDQTRVLPGHGPETTIGQERVTNPFLQ
jgi:glyoxylase-like metal-dependent hydrolase (beta-lactamase superfamily II)